MNNYQGIKGIIVGRLKFIGHAIRFIAKHILSRAENDNHYFNNHESSNTRKFF